MTVSTSARREDIARARAIAEACGLPFLKREQASGSHHLIIERTGVRLIAGEATVRSHPGMGLVRLRRLLKGEERDPLVDLAELRPGDRVLDATFGFGQDSLVLAHAVQPGGRVVALESSPLLAALAMAGVSFWPEPAARLASGIELRCINFRQYLSAVEPKSFDVVYFDPMFRKPKPAAPDFAVLRTLAEMEPLTAADLQLAERAARRLIVVKDAWPGNEIQRLGLNTKISRRSAEIVYGWRRIAS